EPLLGLEPFLIVKKHDPLLLMDVNPYGRRRSCLNPMHNGPLPPRRMRRKRRRFAVYNELITLVLCLFSGMLYAQAAGIFFEKGQPSQTTDAAETSEDLAALPGSSDPEEIFGDGEDIELKQEQPDESSEQPLKEKAEDIRKKAENNQ